MRIYLDYNLFAYLFEGNQSALSRKVQELSEQNMFPYSPAHMEEIATALIYSGSIDPIDRLISAYRKIDSISKIARNVELFPADYGPMILKHEHPLECFRRVVMQYNKNPSMEKQEEQMLIHFKDGDPQGDLANRMSNLPVDFLVNSDHGRDLNLRLHFDDHLPFRCKRHGVKELTWPHISGHFPVLERALEVSMNFLEMVRYRPEHVRKSRSRIHDVTHCIYASGCEQFVTNDRRLYDKVSAVYRYFDVSTRVVTLDQFLTSTSD